MVSVTAVTSHIADCPDNSDSAMDESAVHTFLYRKVVIDAEIVSRLS